MYMTSRYWFKYGNEDEAYKELERLNRYGNN